MRVIDLTFFEEPSDVRATTILKPSMALVAYDHLGDQAEIASLKLHEALPFCRRSLGLLGLTAL